MQLHSSECSVRLGIKSGLYSISSFYYKAIFFHSVNHLIPRLMSSLLNIKKRALWKMSWRNITLISMKKFQTRLFLKSCCTIDRIIWSPGILKWHFQTVGTGSVILFYMSSVYPPPYLLNRVNTCGNLNVKIIACSKFSIFKVKTEKLASSCNQNSPTSFLFKKSILVIFLLFSISHPMAFNCNNSFEIKSCPNSMIWNSWVLLLRLYPSCNTIVVGVL